MRFKFIFTFFVISVLALIGCDSNEPEENSKFKLAVEDVSCTEAWLKISNAKGGMITLKRDDKEIMQFKLTGTDTIVVDDSLLPNKSYQYEALSGNWILSNKTSATTMDTTSHNFVWQTYIFGEPAAGSSYLNDVAIIDEENIWSVGKIGMLDSLGQIDYAGFNGIKWDGEKWELKRIQFYTICGQNHKTPYPAKSSTLFDVKKLLVSMYDSQITTLYNDKQIETHCLSWPFEISKGWCLGSNELFLVGSDGYILHNSNNIWQKIESGTELYLSDIYGKDNNVFVCASDGNNGGGLVLKKNGNKFEKLVESKIVSASQVFKPYLFGTIGSLWVDEGSSLYVGGANLYRYKLNKWEYMKGLQGNKAYENSNAKYRGYITGIRGNTANDFFICGDRNTLLHYNGYSWQQIGYPYDPQSDIIWQAVEAKGNTAVAVGMVGSKAIIMMMKRD